MIRRLLVLAAMVLLMPASQAQQQARPKIGLTLSGGGAKGLAHIGILKAIDSAGLKIDYVTGTSMGSIVGSLYAAGYTGSEIEQIAKKIDWEDLLTNTAPLRGLGMMEKDDNGKFAVEFPFANRKFKLPGGLLESEELWLKFNELFFPVYDIKDFSKLTSPFKCIATDVTTKEAIVLDSGELVLAVRASMSIPTAFTPVQYKSHLLVDGGLVRNLPASDVKNMGADIIIGSDVSQGVLSRDKIAGLFQIMQMVYFREDVSAERERQTCDIYIQHPLKGYSASSFSADNEIIEQGNQKGIEMYPVFKKLADSINRIYGTDTNRILQNKHAAVFIASYEIPNYTKKEKELLLRLMRFKLNRSYTAAELSACFRKAYATGSFKKINYSLQPLLGDTAKIIFDMELNPISTAKLALNVNSFTGSNIILNYTARGIITKYSKSQATLSLGRNFRIKGEQLINFGRSKNISVRGLTQFETLKINTYTNFKKVGIYTQGYFNNDLLIQVSALKNTLVGIGCRYESLDYTPDIAQGIQVKGGMQLLTTYFFFKQNTLNNNIYPTKGNNINLESGHVFDQHPDFDVLKDNAVIGNQDSFGFKYRNYNSIRLSMEQYIPASKRSVFYGQFQSGINFNYKQTILNDLLIGGLNTVMRNQITFAGLDEGSVGTGSVAGLLIGWRYKLANNLFLTPKANALYYDFINRNNEKQKASFLSGYALTMGYKFLLGVLEISAMYCDQSGKVNSYINLGFAF